MKHKLILALAFAGIAAAASAQAAGPEDLIKARQSGYNFMAWNMGKIKGQVVENPASFNKEQVIAAANAIAAIANSGMGALYAPGTETGTGWKPTRANADMFQKPEEVKKVAIAFNKEANELAKVAAGGNIDAIRAQFGKVGETCKSCHDSFRTKD